MKYTKPDIIKLRGKLPPITTNFAPPPVEKPDGPGIDEDPSDDDIYMVKKQLTIVHSVNHDEYEVYNVPNQAH